MSASTRPDVRACPDCRLTFSSRQLLRRHSALDHRAAPDGAWLTSQLVGAPDDPDGSHRVPAVAARAGAVAQDTDARPSPVGRPTARQPPARVPWLLVVLLVALAALTVHAGPLAGLAVVVTWAVWGPWRARRRASLSAQQQRDGRPTASP